MNKFLESSRLNQRSGTMIALFLAGSMVSFPAQSEETFQLLNEQELQMRIENPETDEANSTRALSLLKNNGPTIRVASPKGYSLKSPVNFDIQIKPRGGVAVKMASLKIEYKIGGFWANITRRIAGRASIKGSRLRARGAKLPTGKHSVRLSIKDAKGRITTALVTFAVK